MTQAVVPANYFEGGRHLTRGSSEDDLDLATIVNNFVADIVAAPTAAALALALADTTPASEGASLIGTDAKANLGASTTVEDCLTSLNTKNSPSAAQLASIVGGSEGASLIGTDAKASLGASTTVEACLTNIDTKNPPARSSGVIPPVGVPAAGDGYVDTATKVEYGAVGVLATDWRPRQDEDLGAVPAIVAAFTGQPVAGQTLQIGVDTYEADGVGANINFAIGVSQEATYDNLIAAANANATGNYRLAKLSAAAFAILGADAPHGTPVAGSPNVALVDGLANLTLNQANLNVAGGRAAGISKYSVRQYTLGAGESGFIAMSFPFNVARYRVTARAATGAGKYITETTTIPAGALQTVAVSVGTGATPLINTDVLIVEAWS